MCNLIGVTTFPYETSPNKPHNQMLPLFLPRLLFFKIQIKTSITKKFPFLLVKYLLLDWATNM
jgi:hypothetical protein